MSERSGYQSGLNAMTGGQGRYSIALSHCEAVPPHVQADLVRKHKVYDEQ